MKYLFFLLLFGVAVYAIPTQEKGQFYGSSFDYKEAKTINEITSGKIDSVGKYVTVSGIVNGVCQNKGCWLTLKNDKGDIRSSFKDYGFFVPKDIAGREVVLTGMIREEKVPGATEQHFREDAGDTTKVDIPEYITKQTFVASGVFVKN